MIQKLQSNTSAVQTQTIRTLSEFEGLRNEWEQIDNNPMNSFDWNLSWWRAFQSTGELNIIRFERDGETVGIAPFYIDKWYGAKRLRFLSSGKTCSDYLDLICPTEDMDTVGESFADYIRENKFGVVELEGTRADRLSLQLKSLLVDDYRMDHRDIEPTWVLDLPGSWDEFMKSSKSSIRRKLRKCEKRLASGECTISTTADGAPFDEAFESFKELHQLRFKSKGEPGVFSDPKFEAFMKDGIFRLCNKQQAEIAILKHGDETIGAQSNLISNSGFQYYQSGYSPEHMQLEPGYVMFTAMIKTSIDRGYESFDFLRGNEPYKAKWGARPSEHKKLRLVSRRFASTAHAALVSGARKIADFRS